MLFLLIYENTLPELLPSIFVLNLFKLLIKSKIILKNIFLRFSQDSINFPIIVSKVKKIKTHHQLIFFIQNNIIISIKNILHQILLKIYQNNLIIISLITKIMIFSQITAIKTIQKKC